MLEVREVSKYFGGLEALQRVSLNVDKGSVLGVIGPNGAGKTTLFNVIAGNLKPDGGSIIFKGEDIAGLAPHKICERGLTRTYQMPKLFSGLTIIENVMVGSWSRSKNLKEARKHADKVLDFVSFKGRRDVPAKTIMAADRKRIELAKAMATEPELLLLDETVAGLNPVETSEVIDIIRKISNQGVTVVVIEHVLQVVMNLCELVFVLNEGRKLAEGTPKEIVNNPEVINAYLGEEHVDAGS